MKHFFDLEDLADKSDGDLSGAVRFTKREQNRRKAAGAALARAVRLLTFAAKRATGADRHLAGLALETLRRLPGAAESGVQS